MSLLIWNVRGLGNPRAFTRLRKLLRSSSPDLVLLLETKLAGRRAKFFYRRVGYDNGFHVDSKGKSGGLLVLWKSDWDLEILNFSRFHIDLMVTTPDGFKWRFSGIYGHPVEQERKHTWGLMRRLAGLFDLPWVCGGISTKFSSLERNRVGERSLSGQFRILVQLWRIVGLWIWGLQVRASRGKIGRWRTVLCKNVWIGFWQIRIGRICTRNSE